jgi:hypothetical protein
VEKETGMKLKWMLVCLFAIIFILIDATSAQSLSFNQNCRLAYEEVLSLNFEKSKKMLEDERKANPDNLMADVIDHYTFFLKAFITEEQKDLEILQNQKKKLLIKLESFADESPYKNWAIANAHLQTAFARSKFDQQYMAALEIRKAYLLLESNQKEYPDFLPNQLGLGLLYALIGSVPPQYQWVLKLISMKGSVREGSEMLYHILQVSKQKQDYAYLRSETLFYLTFIEMNLKAEAKDAERLLTEFRFSDRTNLLLSYARANLEMRLGRNDAAIRTLSTRIKSTDYLPFHYLDFLHGEALLRKLDTTALQYYNSFISHFNGRNYHIDAMRKTGWIYLIRGEEALYHKTLQSISHLSQGYSESDRQAYREVASGQLPHINLLKSRLLFDGGYYAQSKALMLKLSLSKEALSANEKLEFYYRFGRIEQALKNNENALKFYQQAISYGAKSPLYFACSAALSCGQIYETEMKIQEAEKMYKLCLSLKPEEYMQGLHFKAKAGLNRLSEIQKNQY